MVKKIRKMQIASLSMPYFCMSWMPLLYQKKEGQKNAVQYKNVDLLRSNEAVVNPRDQFGVAHHTDDR